MLPVTQMIIASEDSTFSQLLCAAIPPSSGLSVIGIYTSGIGLMDAIRCKKPDVLLIDLMLPGINTLTILNELNQLPSENRPAVYVLSAFASPETVAECDRLGVCFFLRKPIETAALIDLVSRYGSSSRYVSLRANIHPTQHDISMRITQIMSSLRLPAHVAGYRFARECILMTLNDPSMADSVTKILYPAVAKKYDTTWTSVERDIRNAIEIAWKRSNGKMSGFSSVRRPANREFILTIADRVRFEMHLETEHFAPDRSS
ncbi:MAG: response regulator [Clostridia bacterium]|nr:response regulator [Clostridia bacterium]